MPRHHRSVARLVGACVAVVALAACGGDTQRPRTAEWSATWIPVRDEVPDEPTFLAGGEQLCGELLGDVRSHREDLLPAPSEAVDSLVDEWVALVEGMSLDCPRDAEDLGARLGAIDVLTREIDDLTGNSP